MQSTYMCAVIYGNNLAYFPIYYQSIPCSFPNCKIHDNSLADTIFRDCCHSSLHMGVCFMARDITSGLVETCHTVKNSVHVMITPISAHSKSVIDPTVHSVHVMVTLNLSLSLLRTMRCHVLVQMYNVLMYTTTCASRVSVPVGHRKRPPPVQVTVAPGQHMHHLHTTYARK